MGFDGNLVFDYCFLYCTAMRSRDGEIVLCEKMEVLMRRFEAAKEETGRLVVLGLV